LIGIAWRAPAPVTGLEGIRMTALTNAKVFRGGVTVSRLGFETSECDFSVNTRNRAIDFRFELASKGGGTTVALLRIGLDDLPLILTSVAEAVPDTVSMFAAAASAAGKTALEDARMVRRVAIRTLETLEEPLDELHDSLHDCYVEAPADDDADERHRLDLIEKVNQTVQLLVDVAR
jgi:hypothetical protein